MAERLRAWVPMALGGLLGVAVIGADTLAPARFRQRPRADRSPEPQPQPQPPPAPPPDAADDGIVENPAWTGDLDGMVERRQVRILVIPNRTDYYLDHGEPKGLTAEYAREFERRLNRRFQTGARPIRVTFVPVTRDELVPLLIAGKGDIAAANLTITAERLQLVDFTPPFRTDVREILVTGPAAPEVASLEDLSGQEVMTRRSSSYWPSLEALDARLRTAGLAGLRLRPVMEALDDEDLLELVAAGHLPWAVVDDHKARAWQRALPKLTLREDLVLRSGGDIGWALRKDSPQLAASLASFTKATAKGTEFGNVVANRYLVAGGPAARQRRRRPQALPRPLGPVREMGRALSLRPLAAGGAGLPGIRPRPEETQPRRCGRHHADPPTDRGRPQRRRGADRPAGEQHPRRGQVSAPPDRPSTSPTPPSPSSTACFWPLPPTMPARAGSPTCAGAPPGAASTPIAGSARSSCRPSATSAARPWPMSATS